MATSDNGWPASKSLPLRPLVVAGESFAPGILDDDDVYAVLHYVAEQMHLRVEPIVREDWHQADDWGANYRPNANDPNSLSRHSAAIAIDYNATRHPNGVPTRETFTPAQIREIRKILAEVDNTVRWGGDYRGTPDAMHFEINVDYKDRAILRRVANRLEDDMSQYAEQLNRIESDLAALRVEEKARAERANRRAQRSVDWFLWLRQQIKTGQVDLAEVEQGVDALLAMHAED